MACLFGHKWDGCRCTKCGKTRDEGHAWDGCVCTACGKETSYISLDALDSEELAILSDIATKNRETVIEVATAQNVNGGEFLDRTEVAFRNRPFQLFKEDFVFLSYLTKSAYRSGSARFRVAESLIAGVKSNHNLDLTAAESIIKENEEVLVLEKQLIQLIEKLDSINGA